MLRRCLWPLWISHAPAVNRNAVRVHRPASSTGVAVVLGALAGIVWGCSFDPEAHPSYCASDADCQDGYECSDHFCIRHSSYCESNADCQEGHECSDHLCTREVECERDADCDSGYECESNRCSKIAACVEGITEPCYDGTPGTDGIGRCRSGERLCVSGTFTQCLAQVVDAPEECNGEDDDCDDSTDEIDDGACDTGLLGACADGQLVCRGAFAVCEAVVESSPETCNGEDDDCDGSVDEGTSERCYPDGEEGCTEDTEGIFVCSGSCQAGVEDCSEGSVAECRGAVTPEDEVCSIGDELPLDEDCDGEVDESCPCDAPGSTRDCYGGPAGTEGVGMCSAGTQVCEEETRQWGSCGGDHRLPEPETCANSDQDDDCDGVVDNILGVGDFCVEPEHKGICREGTLQCEPGGSDLFCLTIMPNSRTEVCDGTEDNPGEDEDCDGQVDEGFDLSSDEQNCGACGRQCDATKTCCQGSCVDLDTDARFCGSCQNSCGASRICCGGECADTSSDVENCGGCGIVCEGALSCCGSCTNTKVDEDNCGSCGNACASGQFCCGGDCSSEACGCRQCEESGGTCCDEQCTDISTDPLNCGACGHACDQGDRTECMDGICCAEGELNCGGQCADPTRDEQHCTGCDVPCDPGETCCGTCVDTDVSALHCGGCDSACSPPDTCSDGRCCPPGTSNCGDECVDLQSDERYCANCDTSCSPGETCCGGSCVDTELDNDNCGECGRTCASMGGLLQRELCCQGQCVPVFSNIISGGDLDPSSWCQCDRECGDEQVCCFEQCVNLMTNPENCGACGRTCTGFVPICCEGICSTSCGPIDI